MVLKQSERALEVDLMTASLYEMFDNKFDFHGLSDGVYYYDLEFTTGTKFKGWVQVLR